MGIGESVRNAASTERAILLQRVKGTVNARLQEAMDKARSAGAKSEGDIDEGVLDSILRSAANGILVAYSDRIESGLRRAGIELAPGQSIDLEVLRGLVNQAAGVDLRGWTAEDIQRAMAEHVNARASAYLGIKVDLFGGDVASQIQTACVEAVRSGRANALINGVNMGRLRMAAVEKVLGVDRDERRRLMNRIYQKRFRKTHRLVWF